MFYIIYIYLIASENEDQDSSDDDAEGLERMDAECATIGMSLSDFEGSDDEEDQCDLCK